MLSIILMAPTGGVALLLAGPYLLEPSRAEQSVVPISVATKKPLLSNLADDSTATKVTDAPECSVYVAKD